MDEQVVNLLIYSATRSPILVACLIGGIYALATRRGHRGVSTLLLLAFLILAMTEIVTAALHYLAIPRLMDAVRASDMSEERVMQTVIWAHRLISTASALASAVAYVLFMFAAFAWRVRGEKVQST